MSSDAIDRVALERLRTLGDADFVSRMIELAVENITERLTEAREAAIRGDAKAVSMALHSIAGSAGNVGAIELEQCARQGLVGSGDPLKPIAADVLERLEAAFTRVRPLLLEATRG
jgi:hypothetical protein